MSDGSVLVCSYKKVWLVRWHAYGEHATNIVNSWSLDGNIVNILSSRKSFEFIEDYAKNIYVIFALTFSEKVPFAHYTKGNKSKRDFFKYVGIQRFYTSKWYIELKKETESDPCSSLIKEKWCKLYEKNSRYITIGNNPFLEVREVFNFIKLKTCDGAYAYKWEELNDGRKNMCSYEEK